MVEKRVKEIRAWVSPPFFGQCPKENIFLQESFPKRASFIAAVVLYEPLFDVWSRYWKNNPLMLFWQKFVDMDAQGTWPKGWPLTFDILFISITAFANFWKRPSHQHRKKIFCILPIDICKQIYSYWQYFLYLFSSGIHTALTRTLMVWWLLSIPEKV